MATPLAFDTAVLQAVADSVRASGPRSPWSPVRVKYRSGRDQKVTTTSPLLNLDNEPFELVDVMEGRSSVTGRTLDSILLDVQCAVVHQDLQLQL